MSQIDSDVCIVGSGVAGSIVALECLRAGLDVTMVEAGSHASGRPWALRALENTLRDIRIPRMSVWHRRHRYRQDDYSSGGDPGFGLPGKTLVVRGGATLGWIGFAFRHMPEDFRLRSATGIGLDWPIDYAMLEPYYVRAEQSLRVAGDHRDEGHPPRSGPFPLPAVPFHKRDRPFLDLLGSARWPEMHNNQSLAPDGGIFTGDSIIDELETFPNYRLLTGTTATEIISTSQDTAAGVTCLNRSNRTSTVIRGRALVIAAGGIETPNLLRVSSNQWWPDGLGNHGGQLGHNLINHCGYGVGGRPNGIRLRNGPVPTTAVTRHFDSPDEQQHGKYILRWVPAPSGLQFLMAKIEQFPTEGNSVLVGSSRTRFGTPSPVINYSFGEQAALRISRVKAHLDSFAGQLGLKRPRRVTYNSAHPMGTTRMTSDPSDGVVDADLRVHFMDNVYVCSTSSFPTGGAANPTLTLAALAHRLGDHLVSDFG